MLNGSLELIMLSELHHDHWFRAGAVITVNNANPYLPLIHFLSSDPLLSFHHVFSIHPPSSMISILPVTARRIAPNNKLLHSDGPTVISQIFS